MCAANCGRPSILKCIAVASKLLWMFDEEEETKKESGQATRANLQEETAKSAREEVLKRSAGRITPATRVKTKLQSHEVPLSPPRSNFVRVFLA